MKFTDKEYVIISKALDYARSWLEERTNFRTDNKDKEYYKLFDALQKKVNNIFAFEFKSEYELQDKLDQIIEYELQAKLDQTIKQIRKERERKCYTCHAPIANKDNAYAVNARGDLYCSKKCALADCECIACKVKEKEQEEANDGN